MLLPTPHHDSRTAHAHIGPSLDRGRAYVDRECRTILFAATVAAVSATRPQTPFDRLEDGSVVVR